jgi:hypothetical protein
MRTGRAAPSRDEVAYDFVAMRPIIERMLEAFFHNHAASH